MSLFIFPSLHLLATLLAAGAFLLPQTAWLGGSISGLSVWGVPLLVATSLGALVLSIFWVRVGFWAVLGCSTLAAGVLLANFIESWHLLEGTVFGISNLYEVSLLLYVLSSAIGLFYAHEKLPPLVRPLSCLLLLESLLLYWLAQNGQADFRQTVPALNHWILPFHVVANFVAYGAFAVSAAAGAGTLLARTEGAKKSFGTVSTRAIQFGFPVFTLAIFLGCVWAYWAWGSYWQWDPKETWALITWLVYAAYLHASLTWKSPQKLALFSLVGFAVTLFCFLGVNLFLSGLHSYGNLV